MPEPPSHPARNTLSSAQAVDLLSGVTDGHRSGDTHHEVAELARLCGRLPLALRIAAERAVSRPHMPLRELIRDLRDESALWDALATDDEEEAHAVRSVFSWSYRVLPQAAARLFRLLGLHPGTDFDGEAAALLADVPVREARKSLDVLVGAHLVEQTGSDRYRFHDLLRSYAQDQIRREESESDREAALGRLLRWYLHTADAAARSGDSHLRHLGRSDLPGASARGFRDSTEARRWFEHEHANLMAAVEAAASARMAGLTWRLAVVLRHFHLFHAPLSAWTPIGEAGVAAARAEGNTSAEADLVETLGMECLRQGRAEQALELHTRALALREGAGDAFGVAMSSNAIGLVHLREHRLERARESLNRCLLLTREIGERRWEGTALGNLAAVELRLGHPRKAVTLAEWAVTIHRETHDRITEFATLACLGMAWRDLGDLESALGALHEALHAAGTGDLVLEAYALMQLGHVQSRRGEPEEALSLYHHAAALHRRVADHRREAECFEGVGRVYLALRRPEEASRFFDRAVAGYRGHGDRWRLAVCLDQWAVVSSELGEAERAREHRAEALDLLEGFDDPEAVSLRARLTAPSG